MTTLWLDLETYSETPITQGTYRYAETAEVMLVAYAFDDEPVEVIDLTAGGSLDNVQLLIDSADKVVIHNSNFDRTVLRCNGVHVPLSKVEDTMAQALAHSLPGSLGALCDVLGVPQDKAKDKHGQKLIHLLTKPRPRNVKLRRATRETHPEEWAAFIEYARLDVDAMRDVSRRLPRWNSSGSERRVWLLDQHVNDRGIAVDVGLAEAALRAFQRSARSLAERAGLLTNGAVPSLTQAARFTAYLKSIGYETPDLTKGTVAAALKGDLPQHVRELLEIRQQASATSPAKYKVLINGVSSDSRLRGLACRIQFSRQREQYFTRWLDHLVRSRDSLNDLCQDGRGVGQRLRKQDFQPGARCAAGARAQPEGEERVRHDGVSGSGEQALVVLRVEANMQDLLADQHGSAHERWIGDDHRDGVAALHLFALADVQRAPGGTRFVDQPVTAERVEPVLEGA